MRLIEFVHYYEDQKGLGFREAMQLTGILSDMRLRFLL